MLFSQKIISIVTSEQSLVTIKCFLALVVVNFTDNIVILTSKVVDTFDLVGLKDLVNLVVSLIIGIYWIVKIYKEKNKAKNES